MIETNDEIKYKKYLKYFNYIKDKPKLSFLMNKRIERFNLVLIFSILFILFKIELENTIYNFNFWGLDLGQTIVVLLFMTLIKTAFFFGLFFLIFISLWIVVSIFNEKEHKQIKEEMLKFKEMIKND